MNAFLLRGTFGRSLRQVWVDSVSIRGAASHSIVLTAVHGDVRDTVLLQQGTDYTCDGGWLVMMAELYNQDFPEELKAAIDADRGNDFVFAMAGDTRGRLIGRVTQETFRTISVWCGDGCRSGKVPFTSHFRTYWYSWEKPGEWSAEAKEDSSRTERLLDEEYMLENGTPRPRPPRPSPR